jgi:hypothetical protein
MAGWWAEAETGFCYREKGIVCAEGTCIHCDSARETVNKETAMEKINALLSDDRFESKDWKHADAVGRIEWLIAMLEQKNKEIDMWVDMINNTKEN